MARGLTNKLYRNFTKGLITEASLLTYPENACIDLDNCILYRKGNLSRRLGVDFESGSSNSPYQINQSDFVKNAYHTYKWESVGNNINKNFLVTQVGPTLRFYDLSASPLSSGLKGFTVNMLSFKAPNVTDAQASLCEMSFAGGKGYLFAVGEKFEPIMVEYNEALDTITATRIYIQVRDFQGLNDGLANDEEPTTLSPEHNYNLLNQGWVDATNSGSGATVAYFDSYGGMGTVASAASTPITHFYTHYSRYPGNNKQWWIAKKSTDNTFDPVLLGTFYFGTGRAPRGHFVVNAFYKDRGAVSGLTTIVPEKSDQRPTSVAFFAGRVWYVCQSTVYYSQVLDDKAKAGFCYQVADPTAEDFSDLVATDGGTVTIPEMGKALKILAIAGGVLIFGSNGIWFVSGMGGGFSALDNGVQKVSPIGTNSPNSIVDTKDGVFWFNKVGIQAIAVQTGAAGTSFDVKTISEETIQGFYNDSIPENQKPYVRAIYDSATNVIQWLFNSSPTGTPGVYDRILNLDMGLGSFFPWTISTTGPKIIGAFNTLDLNPLSENTNVRPTFVQYQFLVPTAGVYAFNFGYFHDEHFADWRTYDGVGTDYLSFIESGYELLDDAMRKKELNYIFCYFRKTEKNYVETETGYDIDYQSSCILKIKWDWASTMMANKWSSKVEAYRHNRVPMFTDEDLSFDTGYPIVISKNKVRGHGRAIQFRFESNGIGKDFDLLGWAVPVSGNVAP